MNRNDIQNSIISNIYTNVTEDITGDKLQVILRELNDNLVNKDGDTMNGALTLSADPTSNLQATTKQYVDNKIEDSITNGVINKAPSENAVYDALLLKQDNLQSSVNIKTIEGQTLLGSGNIDLNKSDVGLSNVDNTSDANKPISTATQTALNLKEDSVNKGIANGYAGLDGSGKVPSSQLPSYVDDVVEVTNYAALPVIGETGKIYITIDTGYIYRWTGSLYVKIADQIQADWNQTNNTALDYIKNKPTISVGLSMPSAFTVTGSPTSNGTIAVSGAGLASQYVRGDGQLATLPTSQGGGSALSFYLNGSVNQGTFGGNAYKQLSRTAVIGPGTDFTINTDGVIARFITDANDPGLLSIPSGNWNIEFFFSASSSGGTPNFYVNVYKYNGGTFTLLGTNSIAPEGITNGTVIDTYFTAVTIPTASLLVTDRIAVEIYVNNSGRTITLHTEDNHLSNVITTFSTGLNALNGLTSQVQYLATGTSGSDFAINSSSDTHTFNLPTASATKRGALNSTDWSTFNGKQDALISGTNIKTINGNTILGSGDLQLATTKIRRHQTTTNYDYLGWAIDGTAESSPTWTLTRLTLDSSGTSAVMTATDSWNNRVTATYS